MEQNYIPRKYLTTEEKKVWMKRIRESLEDLKKEIHGRHAI